MKRESERWRERMSEMHARMHTHAMHANCTRVRTQSHKHTLSVVMSAAWSSDGTPELSTFVSRRCT